MLRHLEMKGVLGQAWAHLQVPGACEPTEAQKPALVAGHMHGLVTGLTHLLFPLFEDPRGCSDYFRVFVVPILMF